VNLINDAKHYSPGSRCITNKKTIYNMRLR